MSSYVQKQAISLELNDLLGLTLTLLDAVMSEGPQLHALKGVVKTNFKHTNLRIGSLIGLPSDL